MASREFVRKYDDARAGRSVLTDRDVQDSRWKGEEVPTVDTSTSGTVRTRKTAKKKAVKKAPEDSTGMSRTDAENLGN